MEIVLIATIALLASILTFFSGFGLGTLLFPVFALFFPPEAAIALTAVVHLINNLFKLSLTFKHINRSVLLQFGLSAIPAAIAGAWLLSILPDRTALAHWTAGESTYEITLLKLIISALLIVFALFELVPKFKSISFSANWLPFGGLLSGFFGGLSGHQGALRSAFLLQLGLSKETFIGTGVAIACFIDFARLPYYFKSETASVISENLMLVVVAVLAAIAGAIIGNRYLKKMTLSALQGAVGFLILAFALALGAGLV